MSESILRWLNFDGLETFLNFFLVYWKISLKYEYLHDIKINIIGFVYCYHSYPS